MAYHSNYYLFNNPVIDDDKTNLLIYDYLCNNKQLIGDGFCIDNISDITINYYKKLKLGIAVCLSYKLIFSDKTHIYNDQYVFIENKFDIYLRKEKLKKINNL